MGPEADHWDEGVEDGVQSGEVAPEMGLARLGEAAQVAESTVRLMALLSMGGIADSKSRRPCASSILVREDLRVD